MGHGHSALGLDLVHINPGIPVYTRVFHTVTPSAHECGAGRRRRGFAARAPSARKRAQRRCGWSVVWGAQRHSRSHSLARSLGRMSVRSGVADREERGWRALAPSLGAPAGPLTPTPTPTHHRSTADSIRHGAAEPTYRPSARPAALLHPTVSACLPVSQRWILQRLVSSRSPRPRLARPPRRSAKPSKP